VENIVTSAEEVIEQRARGGPSEDVVPVDDRLEWLKTIDAEDIWGKEKFLNSRIRFMLQSLTHIFRNRRSK
jgi:hypothetical protein